MKKILRNDRGFTLIEMMIVLLIISVLILISIPNVTKHSANIDKKGCAAYINTMRVISNLSKKLVIPMDERFLKFMEIKKVLIPSRLATVGNKHYYLSKANST